MKIKTFYAASLLFIYSSSAFALAAGEACSSQGSTAHTGSSSGGVSLMCNGSTWVEIVTYNTTGEAHFKKPLKTAAPVANTDVATKEYVDNAVASAGGGGGGGSASSPLVFTKKEYTGNYGGQSGGDAKCAQEYPGYRMCNPERLQKIHRTMQMPDPKKLFPAPDKFFDRHNLFAPYYRSSQNSHYRGYTINRYDGRYAFNSRIFGKGCESGTSTGFSGDSRGDSINYLTANYYYNDPVSYWWSATAGVDGNYADARCDYAYPLACCNI